MSRPRSGGSSKTKALEVIKQIPHESERVAHKQKKGKKNNNERIE
jgi:hypothetical protein